MLESRRAIAPRENVRLAECGPFAYGVLCHRMPAPRVPAIPCFVPGEAWGAIYEPRFGFPCKRM